MTLFRRMLSDARGNVAMLFGLSLPVLILMTVGGVDLHRASTVRVNLQDALDAAALAAARSPYTTNADLQRVGLRSLRANLKAYPNVTLREADTSFVLNSDDVVIARSKVDVKTLVANIFLPPYGKFMDDNLPVAAHSEVDRSSRNIEVAMVLDLSGSMGGQKLRDLKDAAKELVDLIVQPVQTPYYSRVALVPWSYSVNPGSYLTSVRGSVTGSTAITGISWYTGTPKTVTAATKANPAVITAPAHGFRNGDKVAFWDSTGMTELNGVSFTISGVTDNTFRLSGVNSRSWRSFSGTASVAVCARSDCNPTVTAPGHGIPNNGYVHFTDIRGMTQLNSRTHQASNITANSYTIDTVGARTYSSGGLSWCAQFGCTYYAFENENEDLATHRISSCVTERTGAQAYTDAAPAAGARVGRHYPSISGSCLGSTIEPLSSSISGIKADIDAFSVSGSTAGQIGIAWGWYMVSPNFSSLWPSSGGAAYNTAETLKAVIIMTDGEFNAPYCNGVTARGYNASSSASNNCDPDNGEPYAQSRALCDAMKARGVVVYTVGFQISRGGGAERLLQYCASTAGGFHNAGSGTELSEAFNAIGRDITQLRISR
jgi:Flp pilus assembly protein TadG